MNIDIREIQSLQDPLLPAYLDLYETAFPADERIPVSSLVKILQARDSGADRSERLLAACNEGGALVGMALVDTLTECSAAYLVYLAVVPESRGGGIGGSMMEAIHQREAERSADIDTIIFEVDRPENNSGEEQILAERRIKFYERAGARLLSGIKYTQRVDFYPDGRSMHLMFIPLKELEADRACEIAECIFGDDVSRGAEPVKWVRKN